MKIKNFLTAMLLVLCTAVCLNAQAQEPADDANLDPDRGGLTVWNEAIPSDWKTQRYIGDTAACKAYLARVGAKSVTIPYRCNRAVVFASNLFHETDRMHFKDGYTNRRINITMLYGRGQG